MNVQRLWNVVVEENSMQQKKGRVSVIGIAPFGYDRMEHVDREKIKFEINEEEAKIVRDLFEWVGQERISIKKQYDD